MLRVPYVLLGFPRIPWGLLRLFVGFLRVLKVSLGFLRVPEASFTFMIIVLNPSLGHIAQCFLKSKVVEGKWNI